MRNKENRELISDNSVYSITVERDLKHPFHAFCEHKASGVVVEQASQHKTNAIHLAEKEMNIRILTGEIVSTPKT